MTSHEDSYRYKCEPAATVIRALGGVRRAAKLLCLSPETVSRWNRPADRNGTGGFIPHRLWDDVLEAAGQVKAKNVTRELLMKGERETAALGMLSRRKGAAFEQQLVRDFNEAGIDAHRVPLSGADKNYKGDLILETPTGRWVLQAKIAARAGGRHAVLRLLKEAAIGKVVAGGLPLIAMRRSVFEALVKGEFKPPVNLSDLEIQGRTILDHLKGHDALVFRKSGKGTWMALLTEAKYKETLSIQR